MTSYIIYHGSNVGEPYQPVFASTDSLLVTQVTSPAYDSALTPLSRSSAVQTMNTVTSFYIYLVTLFTIAISDGVAFRHVSNSNERKYRSSNLYSTQSPLEGRLYRISSKSELSDINSYIARLQKIPEIKPDPPVMDDVEEYYATQYETYRFFPKDKAEITVSVRKTSFGCGKLGSSIWRCGLALSCYLVSIFDHYDESQLESTRVIELGAGLGLASCVCRELGVGKVMATDFWEEQTGFGKSLDKKRLIPHKLFGDNLEFNVVKCAGIANHRQEESEVLVAKLDWSSEVDAFRTKVMFDPTLIIGSDIVYRAEDTPPLLRTLELLMGEESSINTPVQAILFLDYNGRNDEDVNEFRFQIKELVNSNDGWALIEEELKLCYWMDKNRETYQEKYSILEVRISNKYVSL